MYLYSSPGGLFGVGAVCCFCFGAGVFRLVSRVEFLWFLCCGWFVVLRSLVGGVVALLHCSHCARLVVFVVSVFFCSTYSEFIIVSCVIFMLHSCVVILSVPVVCINGDDTPPRCSTNVQNTTLMISVVGKKCYMLTKINVYILIYTGVLISP